MNLVVHERIKSNRKRIGFTQTQLGEVLGVQKSAIQKYESGSVTNIKLTTLVKMAEVFGVSVSSLLGDKLSSKQLNDLLYETYGTLAIELFRLFGELDDVGKMKVLAYAQDIGSTYKLKGE